MIQQKIYSFNRFYIYAMFTWLCLIWVVSSLPADVLPVIDALNVDKVEHVSVYFVLALLTAINYEKGFFIRLTRQDVFMALVLLACLDEAHQYFCINRVVSVLDLSANITGVSAGYFISGIRSRGL
jgi:VanZ family protein